MVITAGTSRSLDANTDNISRFSVNESMERVIQQTDYDALSCRISAIYKGYLPSPSYQAEECGYTDYGKIHLEYLNGLKHISRSIYGKVTRTMRSSYPVMNYGTYLRTISIDTELSRILKETGGDNPVQIIDLGCGSDLRMIPILRHYPQVKFIDVDYAESTKIKSRALWEAQILRELLKLREPSCDDEQLVCSDRYKLISCDLNDLNQTSSKLNKVTKNDLPTIIITECVLCYMSQDASQRLIEHLGNFYRRGYWISYDPIGGSNENDRFGAIMQTNLRDSRNLELPTLMVFNSKEKYSDRFAPWQTKIRDMWEIFNETPPEEIKRLKSLQFLDEIEELRIMQTHYVFCIVQWGY